jgi:hypothetical protein
MSDKTEYSRLLIKRATETGVVPTIPTGTTLSTFTNTDLFVGELFLNTTDENLWVRTDNGILQILNSGFTSSIFATGFTYDNANTLTISNNNGSTLQTSINTMTGLTVNGAFSATTLFGDGSGLTGINSGDIFVTGFTYDNANKLTIVSNSGASLNAFINVMTGLTINGAISATTYQNLPIDPDNYVTGGTFSSNTLTLDRQNGSVTITGFTSDIYTTGFTYNNANTLTISDNGGNNYSATINTMTGLTINGAISATTYQNLPIDPDNYVTGGTFSSGTLTLDRQNGSVTITGFTDTIFSGGSGNCITDLYVSNIIGCSPLSIFSDTSISGFTTGGSYTAKDVNSGGDRLKRTITKSSTGEISELDQQLDRLKFDSDANNGNLYTSTQMIDYIEFNTLNDTSKFQGVIKYVDGVGIELSETKVDTGEYYRLTLDKIGNEIISDDNSGTTANFVNTIVGNTLTTTNGTDISSIDNNSTNTIIAADNGTQNSYLDTQYNSIQAVTTDTASGDFGNLTLNPTSLELTSLEGTFNNKSVINITPIQTTASAYDDSLAANVTSITLLNTSTDGSAIITAIGNTSVLSQDTLSLDPLNGSYLKSQSTTGTSYTELAFNNNDIAIAVNDGTYESQINMSPLITQITNNNSVSSVEVGDSATGAGTVILSAQDTNTGIQSRLELSPEIDSNIFKSQSTNDYSQIDVSYLDITSTSYDDANVYTSEIFQNSTQVRLRTNDNVNNVSFIELTNNTDNTGSMVMSALDDVGFVSDQIILDPSNAGLGTTIISLNTSTSEYSEITLTPSQLEIKSDNLIDSRSITIIPTGITVTGGVVEYDADYSSQYTNRSIVDKGYVDSVASTGSTAGSFGLTIDGGGSAITTGVKGYITIPYNGTITGWDIFADTTGSIVVDVWKDTYANFPPTVADTIAGSEKPTLSSAVKNQDTNLTSWTTSVTAGDIVAFNVDSAATVTRVNLIIYITKQ